MSDNLRPDSDVIERVTEMLCELAELGYYRGKEIAEALAATSPLTPSDTFASTKPSDAERPYCPVHGDLLAGVRSERCRTAPAGHESDAEHLLSVVETIKETGGSVQIRGVLITPCDTYGQPLNARPDADAAERIAQAWDEGYRAHEDEYWCGTGKHPYRATPPETPGFEGDDRG